ncbi:MAG: AraC family transcriptional regulator [Cyanobacteria bacterium J06635_15]
MPPRFITTSQEVEAVFSGPPLITTGGFQHGLHIDCRWEPASEVEEVATPWHVAVVFTSLAEPAVAERKLDGRVKIEQVHPGDVIIVPAHVGHGAKWNASGEFISFAFEPTALVHAVDPAIAPSELTLVPKFATQDLLVLQLGLTLKKLLASGEPIDGLYMESLTHTLAIHLLQQYGTRQLPLKTYTDGLSQNRLTQLMDYIYAHLDSDLSLNQLAQLVDMSPHYFSQLFKQSTGLSPHQYIIQCRINRAKALLRNTQKSIAEIAYQVGFANQSHLNRHFKRTVGATPRQFRAQV